MENLSKIYEIINKNAVLYPERVALQMHSSGKLSNSYTYGQLLECFQSGAKRLKEYGLKKGDRVVLIAENCPEWGIAYLAALCADTTVVLLDPTLTAPELVHLIKISDPRGILISHKMYEKLALDIKLGLPVLDIEGAFASFEETPTVVSSDIPPTPDPDNTIASILFTSGTTGEPKGVLLEHTSLIHSAYSCVDAIKYQISSENTQALCVLPLNHCAGLISALLAPLFMGATITFLSTVRGDTIIAAMQATQTNVLPGVPRLFELFYREILQKVEASGWLTHLVFKILGHLNENIRTLTSWNVGLLFFRRVHKTFGGSLKVCCCGAAPLPIEVERGLERLGFTIIKAYGLTETGIAVCNDLQQSRLGHVGKPFRGVEVRIAQASPSQGEGEICLRGDTLMRGYYRNSETTQEVIRDGWFHTGDLGRFDSDGNLLITGRIKELIVTSGGKKASPIQVEQYYQGLPAIQELAVVGIPLTGGGDEIHCAVVLNETAFGGDISQEERRREIEIAINNRASKIPSHLRIQKVHLLTQLPKTSTLKVKRGELRQLVSTTTESSSKIITTETEVDEISQSVIAIVSGVSGFSKVKLSSTLQFDLGIDSLGLVELAFKLEDAFGIKLTEQNLPTIHTVNNLVATVRAAIDVGTVGNAQPSLLGNDLHRGERTAPIPAPRGFWAKLALTIFTIISRIFWRFEVSGIEHIPATGAFILCPNHESHLDIFWVASCLPREIRNRLCCFAKQEHFNNSFTKLVATIAGAIPTDRDGDILPTLRAGASTLSSGRPLLIHPEGTRTRTGAMLPFRRGAAKLAIATGVPLIPVKIIGAYEIFPPHRLIPNLFNWKYLQRYQLQIAFGVPLKPPQEGGLEAENSLTEHLRQAVESLGK